MPAKRLSAKQQAILDFLRDFLHDHSYPPTVRDIQQGCGISSTSVVDYNLRLLERDGYIRRAPEVSRGIELLDGTPSRREAAAVPVMGYIAAGQPIPVPTSEGWGQAEPLETLELTLSITHGRRNLYALKVRGQSMIDALIDDGDVVVLKPTREARYSSMVVAWLTEEKEATLKRFYREGRRVRLQPANSQMDPIFVDADKVEVHGRVVAVIRTLG